MAMTTSSSIRVNPIPPGAPRSCQRGSARLPASFLFMAVGYINPVAAICRWCAILPILPWLGEKSIGINRISRPPLNRLLNFIYSLQCLLSHFGGQALRMLCPIHPPALQLINSHCVEALFEIPQLKKVSHMLAPPNARDQRPGSTDPELPTGASSPGSLHLACSAIEPSCYLPRIRAAVLSICTRTMNQ